jgi:hypothetical protein
MLRKLHLILPALIKIDLVAIFLLIFKYVAKAFVQSVIPFSNSTFSRNIAIEGAVILFATFKHNYICEYDYILFHSYKSACQDCANSRQFNIHMMTHDTASLTKRFHESTTIFLVQKLIFPLCTQIIINKQDLFFYVQRGGFEVCQLF